jgi:hypothetical protein
MAYSGTYPVVAAAAAVGLAPFFGRPMARFSRHNKYSWALNVLSGENFYDAIRYSPRNLCCWRGNFWQPHSSGLHCNRAHTTKHKSTETGRVEIALQIISCAGVGDSRCPGATCCTAIRLIPNLASTTAQLLHSIGRSSTSVLSCSEIFDGSPEIQEKMMSCARAKMGLNKLG